MGGLSLFGSHRVSHTRVRYRVLCLLALCAAFGPIFACSGGDDESETGPPTVVQVNLQDYTIVPDVDPVRTGRVVMEMRNSGPQKSHDMLMVRSDAKADGLPVREDGSVELDDLDVVAKVGTLEIGKSASVDLVLEPGRYILFCNLVDDAEDGSPQAHYKLRMHSVLTAVSVTSGPQAAPSTPFVP